MWTRAKQYIPLHVPKLQRTERLFKGTQFATTFHGSNFRVAVIPGNIASTVSFLSTHQPPRETSSFAATMTHEEGVVERTIREKILVSLSPVSHLTIVNESHRHNVPANSETHFKVVIVTPVFETIPTLVGRHRLVNTVLADELSQSGPIHALSIVAKTPAQWLQQQQQSNNNMTIEPSPPCLGGDGTLPPKNTK